MLALAVIGGALLWFSLDKTHRSDPKFWRKLWPIIAIALIGLVLTAKGRPLIGIVLVGGAALWARKPWQRRASPRPARDRLARADARDLLGVPADADDAAIIAAHRRLIARNHPDSGGSAGLAARLNAARDLLLQQERH